ncbi:MAG: hypothetical protein ACOCRN_03460, partial [Spirochaetia bacterium]
MSDSRDGCDRLFSMFEDYINDGFARPDLPGPEDRDLVRVVHAGGDRAGAHGDGARQRHSTHAG